MKKKIAIVVLVTLLLTSVNNNVFAIKKENATPKNTVSRGVGDTFTNTFPDPIFAGALAQQLGKTVDDIITQEMVDSLVYMNVSGAVTDLTGIEIFTNVTALSFFGYEGATFSDEICKLTKINNLQINNSKIKELPTCIGDLKNLTSFSIMMASELKTLPESFGELTNLTSFTIMDAKKFESLPESMSNLTSLDMITISMTSLKAIPENIGNATNLRMLNLNNNSIEKVPDSIVNLPKLEALMLSINNITSLPDGIGNIPTLQNMFLDNNQLTSLPNSIVNYNFNVGVTNNFLPTNYIEALNENRTENLYTYSDQNQLTMSKEVDPYTVMNGNDLTTFDFASVLKMVDFNGGETNAYKFPPEPYVLSTTHNYIFDNYVDESGAAVNINDYIKNGIVQQDVTLFAHIRSTGTGLYPNTSDHALTVGKVQLNLVATPYDVVYDLNGSTETAPASESLVEGAKVTAVDAPIREGYIFKGWNTKADGTGTKWDFNNTTMPAENVTLFAMWEKVKVEYTLTFDLNGVAGVAPTTQSVLEGEVATAVTNPISEGLIFMGWNTKADGTGTNWNFTTTPMPEENVTLFAIWENEKKEYPLTFDLNGGNGSDPIVKIVEEGDVVNNVVTPVREGYIFKGWNTKPDGTGLTWILGETTMPAEGVKLYAVWEAEPTVTVETTPTTKLPQTGSTLNLFGIVTLLGLAILGKLKIK